ncbi:MAG: hypothetical protein JW802_05525 [Campylobacterales bacterium]|nr:hypothetical protein [Campylobacterales bacterium]
MGAVAVDYVNKPSNNATYKGSGAVKAPTPPISASSASTVSTVSAGGSTLGKVLSVGKNVLGRFNTIGMFVQGMDYVNDKRKERLAEIEAEYAKLDETQQAEKEALEQAMAYEKGAIAQEDKAQEVKQEAGAIADSVVYNQGDTLPSVLTQNAKALTQSLNTLTTTINEQFSLLNNYMMANLIVQGQFLDLKTAEGDLKVESMQYAKTPVASSVLKTDSVVGMSPREIEVSHRSNEVEARVYARNPVSVKDWDENVLADIAPREAELVKNATLAKDTTDKINFEVEDDWGLDDIVDGIDISQIFGYSPDSDVIKEAFNRLGGSGL